MRTGGMSLRRGRRRIEEMYLMFRRVYQRIADVTDYVDMKNLEKDVQRGP